MPDGYDYYNFADSGSDGGFGALLVPADEIVKQVLDAVSDGGLGDMDPIFESDPEMPLESTEAAPVEAYALGPITSSTGLKGALLDVIGPYDGIVTQYRYQQANNSYYTYVNDITPDYPWILSCLMLIVLVHGVFKAIQRCFFR